MKKTSGPPVAQIVTILTVLAALIMVITMRQSCADGMAGMFKAMDAPVKRVDGGAH